MMQQAAILPAKSRNTRTRKFLAAAAAVVVLLLAALFMEQFFVLQKAHSSFSNYAAFRGCQRITSRSDISGTCTLASGQSIKIVKFNGKWYLDGDLPFCWNGVCF